MSPQLWHWLRQPNTHGWFDNQPRPTNQMHARSARTEFGVTEFVAAMVKLLAETYGVHVDVVGPVEIGVAHDAAEDFLLALGVQPLRSTARSDVVVSRGPAVGAPEVGVGDFIAMAVEMLGNHEVQVVVRDERRFPIEIAAVDVLRTLGVRPVSAAARPSLDNRTWRLRGT